MGTLRAAALVVSGLAASMPALATAGTIRFAPDTESSFSAGEEARITGTLAGAADVESVEIFYRSASTGGWRNREIDSDNGKIYAVTIPATDVAPPTLEYFVVAIDFLGNRIPALASESAPHEVRVDVTDEDGSLDDDDVLEPLTPGLSLLDARGTTRIERAQIAAIGARNLLDVLRIVGELEIARDVRGFHRVAIRGQGRPGDVRLEVDGMSLLDAYDAEGLWEVPAALIESVEVQRTPAASPLASLGPAGIVRVRLRSVAGFAAQVQGGSYASHLTSGDARRRGTGAATVLAGTHAAGVDLSGFAEVHATDGSQRQIWADAYRNATPSSRTPGPLADQQLGAVAGLEATTTRLFGGETHLVTRYMLDRRGGYVGASDTYSPDGAQHRQSWRGQVRHKLRSHESWTLDTTLGGGIDQRQSTYELTPPDMVFADRDGDGAPESVGDSVREQTRWSTSTFSLASRLELYAAAKHTARVHVALDRSVLNTSSLERNLTEAGIPQALQPLDLEAVAPDGTTRTTVLLAAEDLWQPARALQVELGLTLAYFSDLDRFETGKQLMPRLAVRYRASRRTELFARYGTTVRPPTLAERYDAVAASLPTVLQSGRFVGTSGLRGASTQLVEVGAAHHLAVGELAYSAEMRAFAGRVHDSIVPIVSRENASPVSQRALVELYGASLDARVSFAARSHVSLSSWWQRTVDVDGGTRHPVTDVAPLGAVLALQLELADAFDLHVATRYSAARASSRRTTLERLYRYELPAYAEMDVALMSRPNQSRLRYGVTLHNALDAAHSDPAPRPDRLPEMTPAPGLQVLAIVEVLTP